MPYCPKCDLEFVEGIKECTECHSPLIPEKQEPEPNRVPVAHVDPEDADRMIAFLEYAGVKNVLKEDCPDDDSCRLMCPEKDYHQAVKLLQVFYANEKSKTLEESKKEEEQAKVGVYVKKSDKAKEARSSAYSFLLVGALVIVFDLLWFMGIIDLPFGTASKILMQVVFGAMGIIFFLVGVNTFRGLSKLERDAVTEEKEYDAIVDWFVETYTKKDLDSQIQAIGNPEDPAFDFARFDLIREKLTAKCPSGDESYIEALCEEIYQKLYER